MKRTNRCAIGLLLTVCMLGANVMADPPAGKGNPNKHQGNSSQGQSQNKSNSAAEGTDLSLNLVLAGITTSAARNLALNTGSTGYPPLPPGIAKNLGRGKPLPPGIAKKAVPSSMLGQLPNHAGYQWQSAGSDLVLVKTGTAIVADVLKNVFQ